MHEECGKDCCCDHYHGASGVLFKIILVIVIVAGILLIRNWYKSYDYIGQAQTRDTIAIQGMGKVVVVPDIATFNIGLVTNRLTVAAAQKENTDKMNNITKALKDLGIDDKDIKTSNYNISPDYRWDGNRSTLAGYIVNQSVTVKVRDLEKVGDIFAKAGELGANDVSGLQFTVDDQEEFKAQARSKALNNAKVKAEALAKDLGIKLGKVVNFSESFGGGQPTPYYGIGGSVEMMKSLSSVAPAPDVQVGSTEIQDDVTVMYEVL
ncbi:MAG: SIMPL domain-containing protein [Patescibacteria group bacterium]|jgi:hypothetical protein